MERKVYLMYRIANNPAWYMNEFSDVKTALESIVRAFMQIEDWKIVQEVEDGNCKMQ